MCEIRDKVERAQWSKHTYIFPLSERSETFIRYKTPALLDYRAAERLLMRIIKFKRFQCVVFCNAG